MSPITGAIGPLAPTPFPGAKVILEAATNTQLGLAKPIDYQRASSNDWRQSFQDVPGWVKYLPMPIQNWMGVVDTVGGRRVMPATSKYVLNQMSSPFLNNLGQTIVPAAGSTEDIGKARADTVSWLTGIRLIPVDPLKVSRSWAYRMKDMLEGRQQELRDQGMELEPEDAEILYQLGQEIKILEDEWDLRENELYGK